MIKKMIYVAVFFLPVILSAQYNRPGSTSAQFLKMGVSARAMGMGEAFVSVTKSAEAVYYNPAALARITGTVIGFSHNKWFAGINHEFASLAHNFGDIGTLALSMTTLYTDEMDVRTPLQPEGTGETFFATNYRVGASYSRFLTDRVTFGGTLNYINISLYDNFSESAYAADISLLYQTGFRDFAFGMKIANFGSEIKFVYESYPLPTNFSFGLSGNVIESGQQKILVGFDAIKMNDSKPKCRIGAEWNYGNQFFLRAGYKFFYDVSDYSFGGGLNLKLINYRMSFDYAYGNFGLLGGSHIFGIGLAF